MAQRNAVAAENLAIIEQFLREHFTGAELAKQMEEVQRQTEETLVGCAFHFEQSLKRITRLAALVPPDKVSLFQSIIRKLRSQKDDDMVNFAVNSERLFKLFPNVRTWIDWWLQGNIAPMIFPARSTLNADVRKQVPKTSNAAEHQHSLLNRAVGGANDLVVGAQKLLRHVSERQQVHSAIEGITQ